MQSGQPAVTDDERRLADTLRDPVKFAAGWLNSRVWARQAEIMRALIGDRRVVVKACHSSGKTFAAALVAIWWLTRYPDGIVITTAPTWTQVEKLLWGEIHRALRRASIKFPVPNKTELYHREDNYIFGLSTNEGVRFQGFHGRVLIIVDEAPGVDPEIDEAIEGIRAGGDVRTLKLGNPIIAGGPFYDAFTRERALHRTFTISAFDTPNLVGLTLEQLLALEEDQLDQNVAPHLTTRRWVKEAYTKWGPGHPLWESKVLGEFPRHAENALISLAWIEAAAKREIVDHGGPVDVGIDVAGPGEDETSATVVDGPSILKQQAWSKPDPRGELAAFLRDNYGGPVKFGGRVRELRIDAAGIGWHFALHFRDLGYTVRMVNVGERRSADQERFVNLKAEFYWGLRLRFQEGDVAGLTDEMTQGQLTTILYSHDARGRVEIESKEDARKRGIKSPDRAESLMLAYARPRYGWHMVTGDDDVEDQEEAELRSALDRQLARVNPDAYRRPVDERCGNCLNRGEKTGMPWCKAREIFIELKDPPCDSWEPEGAA